jgi:hypothetical protein
MSHDEHAPPHTGLTVHGGTVHIGNGAFGTNPIAISVPREQPGPLRADDGTPVDAELLRQAIADLTAAVRAASGPATARQDQLLTELRDAVTGQQPQRHRALAILGHFADGAATGEAVLAAIGAVLGVLGAH